MKDKQKRMFLEWQDREHHKKNHKDGKPFVCDGAIDEEKWEQAKPKILFLGKEAHNGEIDSWSICKLIQDWGEPKYSLWLNVGRWAHGIQHTTKDNIPDFPDRNDITKALFDSAFVNIKKSGGKSTSDNNDLMYYVKKDRDLIIEQIELLDPHIIIFCYTWPLVKEYWDQKYGEHEKLTEWVYKSGNRILIDYYHPTLRWSSEIMYYALCAIYQKSL